MRLSARRHDYIASKRLGDSATFRTTSSTLESGSRPRGGVRGISEGIPSLGGEHLNYNGGFNVDSVKYVPKKFAAAMTKGHIQLHDILVVKDGATTGKTAFVSSSFPFNDAVVNEHVFICRPVKEIEPRFLFRFLMSKEGQERVLENFKGSAQGGINQTFAPNTHVPLAPFAEQRRIVAKLEKMLGAVSTCEQRLTKIPVLLKRFRQAVLAAACSGGLTANWREENGVDDEWPNEPLSELFKMRNGKSLPVAKRRDGDIPVYGGNGRMGNHNAANADGQVIVIGRVGAHCGNVHFVNGKVWVTDNAISLEAKREVEPAFYAFFLRSKNLNQLSAGTGQPYVSQEILGPIETPIVSLAEQQEIVRRLESLFALADQIEARYTKAKVYVEKLAPTLLARAFRGELVPQDPNDEPAAILLERIRRQKEPKIVEADVEATRRRVIKSNRRIRMKYSKTRTGLFDTLRTINQATSPEDLFRRAGFTPDSVDEFYEELRREVEAGRIRESRIGKRDVKLETIIDVAA